MKKKEIGEMLIDCIMSKYISCENCFTKKFEYRRDEGIPERMYVKCEACGMEKLFEIQAKKIW